VLVAGQDPKRKAAQARPKKARHPFKNLFWPVPASIPDGPAMGAIKKRWSGSYRLAVASKQVDQPGFFLGCFWIAHQNNPGKFPDEQPSQTFQLSATPYTFLA